LAGRFAQEVGAGRRARKRASGGRYAKGFFDDRRIEPRAWLLFEIFREGR